MAAARPAAVVMSASEIPGATARNVAAPAVPRPWNASIMPQTVPNRPINGVTAPVIASQGRLRSNRVISSNRPTTSPPMIKDSNGNRCIVLGERPVFDYRPSFDLCLVDESVVLPAVSTAAGLHLSAFAGRQFMLCCAKLQPSRESVLLE